MSKDLLWELALMAWPLRDLAREEAKTRLKAAVKAGAEGLKGLLEVPPSSPAPAAEVIAPGVQAALRSGLELPPAVKKMLAGKFETSGVQSLDCSTLLAFASRARAAGPASITAATAGAGAQALPSLLDFVVCASAVGVIALALYLIWRGPGGGDD